MKQSATRTLSILLTVATVATVAVQGVPAFGCSFSVDTSFTSQASPDSLQNFAAGKLGIIESTYARSYLAVAYRYLAKTPLSKEEQQDAVALWTDRLGQGDPTCEADTSTWLEARKKVPEAPKLDRIETMRSISADDAWQQYCNCQTPAFVAAANTLNGKIAKLGATSPAVKEWLKGQDLVFSNCGTANGEKGPSAAIPQSLATPNDTQQEKDRAYQIAAANFYSQQLGTALTLFNAISNDPTSPWKEIAAYLAVRTMIRQATLAKTLDLKVLASAHERAKSLLSNPTYAKLNTDISALDSFILARLTPDKHLEDESSQLTKHLSKDNLNEYTKTIDLITSDDGSGAAEPAKKTSVPDIVTHDDLTKWIYAMQGSDDTTSVAEWKKSHSLPWLVAALSSVEPKDASEPALLAASRSVSPGTPGYWTVFHHRMRLLIASGKLQEARTSLDEVLSKPPADLSLSGRNELSTQRLRIASSLNEFVRFAIQATPESVQDTTQSDKSASKPANKMFTKEAGYALDLQMPLSMLQQLAANTAIPSNLRGHLAWTSWVRAVLVGNDNAARSLAIILKPFNAKKAALIDSYLSAQTPDDKKFAAVFLMLQFSSANPNVGWGPLTEDSYGDDSGWWWDAKAASNYGDSGDDSQVKFESLKPLFFSATDKTQEATELKKLQSVSAAPDYFAHVVLAYAKAHPTDPRIPQALSLVVKSTHYGSKTAGTTALSKQAFQLLHNNYKNNTWTKQTPYFY